MSLDSLISGLTKALEAHTAALNQFSRAIEIHTEALKGSHKADELMAEAKAEKKDELEPEKKATAKPKKAAKKEPEPEEKKAAAKPKKAAKKEPEPEETHIKPEEKVVEIHQDNPKVQAAKELSNMLTSAREKGPAVYRQFFRAAKSTLEEVGVSRLQEVPDDSIDEVIGKLREAYDLYVKENEDAEIV